MNARLHLMIFLVGFAAHSYCQNLDEEVEKAKKEIMLYEENLTDAYQLSKAIHAVTAAKEKAGKAIGPEIWKLQARLYHQIAIEHLITSQRGRHPSWELLAVNSPALQAYDAYLSLFHTASRKKRKNILMDLEKLQATMLSISVQDLQRKNRRKQVLLQHRAILSMHSLLKEANMGSALDGRLKWFTYQMAVAAYDRGDIDTYLPLAQGLYEQGFQAPGLYILLYEAFAQKGTRGLAFRYLSEGRRRFPLHGDLMEAEVKYYFELDQVSQLEQYYGLTSERVSIHKEYEIILLYTKLYKAYRRMNDTLGAELNFKLAMRKIQANLEKDQSNYLTNLAAVRLFYDQFLILADELLIVGQECSRSSLRRYSIIRDKIDQVIQQIHPYLDQITIYSDNQLEILEIARTISGIKADRDLSYKYKLQYFKAKMDPQNWHTHVLRQEWW